MNILLSYICMCVCVYYSGSNDCIGGKLRYMRIIQLIKQIFSYGVGKRKHCLQFHFIFKEINRDGSFHVLGDSQHDLLY